jgi:hypothetical protein
MEEEHPEYGPVYERNGRFWPRIHRFYLGRQHVMDLRRLWNQSKERKPKRATKEEENLEQD